MRRSPMLGALKAAIPAAALALSLAAASASHATDYFLQSATMDTSHTAHIYGPGYPVPVYSDEYVFLGPLVFTTNLGTAAGTPTFNLLAFCVDIFHNITLGPLNLKYNDLLPLNSNSQVPASPISAAQTMQVARLVNYGELVYDSADVNKSAKLAGLQGAIWQVINPTYTVVAFDAPVDSLIADYTSASYNSFLTGHGSVGSGISFISETGKYGTLSAHQGFTFAVPEPSTWVLMIGGFGFAGAMLRRDRRRTVRVRA